MQRGSVQRFGQIHRMVLRDGWPSSNQHVQRLTFLNHVDARKPALVGHRQVIRKVQLIGRLVILDHVKQNAGARVVQPGVGQVDTLVLNALEHLLQSFARAMVEILVLERKQRNPLVQCGEVQALYVFGDHR